MHDAATQVGQIASNPGDGAPTTGKIVEVDATTDASEQHDTADAVAPFHTARISWVEPKRFDEGLPDQQAAEARAAQDDVVIAAGPDPLRADLRTQARRPCFGRSGREVVGDGIECQKISARELRF